MYHNYLYQLLQYCKSMMLDLHIHLLYYLVLYIHNLASHTKFHYSNIVIVLNIPVVATEVGGIPELIEHEKNGLLVDPNNSTQLVNSVNELLKNKDKAGNIAQAGHDYVVKNLTWEVLLPRYVKFYEDLLNS